MSNPFGALNNLPFANLGTNIVEWFKHDPDDQIDASSVEDRYRNRLDGIDNVAFDGDYRPTKVAGVDEFDAKSVEQLRASVDQIDLDSVGNLVQAWKDVGDKNSQSLATFRTLLSKGMSADAWQGSARDSAAQTVTDYNALGEKITTAAQATYTKLERLRAGLDVTKQLVPHQPEHRSGIDNALSWLSGDDWRNDDVANANAKAEAKRVLNGIFAPAVTEADTQVPVIPMPKMMGDNGNDGDDPGNGNGGDNGGNGDGSGNPGQDTDPEDTEDPSTPETTEPEDTTTDSDDDTDDTDSTDTDTSTDPQSTTPQSTTPAGVQTTTPGSPGLGSLGTPGTGSPGTGSPGTTAPGAGSAIPGTQSNPGTTASTAARAGTGTGTGSRGMSGMPGAGSRGGGKGEDEEHTKGIPDYLITQEHGDEVTGLDRLPGTVPPVIGE